MRVSSVARDARRWRHAGCRDLQGFQPMVSIGAGRRPRVATQGGPGEVCETDPFWHLGSPLYADLAIRLCLLVSCYRSYSIRLDGLCSIPMLAKSNCLLAVIASHECTKQQLCSAPRSCCAL